MLSLQENQWKKRENEKYLQMTVLYTNYNAEDNAVRTIYVKHGLKNVQIDLEI